jgi:hypothetical protein
MNDFAEWVRIMGYHGKQVSEAAALMGIENKKTASVTFVGNRKLSKSERLAMAAVRAGLPEWTPERDQAIAGAGEFKRQIERAVDERLAARASGK